MHTISSSTGKPVWSLIPTIMRSGSNRMTYLRLGFPEINKSLRRTYSCRIMSLAIYPFPSKSDSLVVYAIKIVTSADLDCWLSRFKYIFLIYFLSSSLDRRFILFATLFTMSQNKYIKWLKSESRQWLITAVCKKNGWQVTWFCCVLAHSS